MSPSRSEVVRKRAEYRIDRGRGGPDLIEVNPVGEPRTAVTVANKVVSP